MTKRIKSLKDVETIFEITLKKNQNNLWHFLLIFWGIQFSNFVQNIKNVRFFVINMF